MTNSLSRLLATPEATRALGALLADIATPGLLIALFGNLGAGKTTLSKGLISTLTGLDPDDVMSPTFTLVIDYDEGAFPIRHLDAYRLSNSQDLIDLGFLDWCAAADSLIIVEWPERVLEALPPRRLEIHLDFAGDQRRFTVNGPGCDGLALQFITSWDQANNPGAPS